MRATLPLIAITLLEVTNANAAEDLNQISTQYTSVKINDVQFILEVNRPFC